MKKPNKYLDNKHWRYSALMYDRSMLDDDQFGADLPYWCGRCGPIRNLTYYMSHRATWETPEEGDDCCDRCGSSDTGERDADGHEAFSLVSRYKVAL